MGVNDSLLKSMQTIVDKAIDVAPFDKTRQAQVITNNADGTYNIRLDGILYSNVPSYPKTNVLEVGSIAKIVMPSNQPSQMYIQSSKGGGGGDHKELTRIEYDALTPEQKSDGTVYFVTDGDPDYFIMSDSVPIGAIQAFGGRVAPEGWLICDGSAISREDYIDLFTVIGTTYGDGDGNTTFNIPDLSGNVIVGVSNDYILGDVGGSQNHDHKYGIQYAGYYSETVFEDDSQTGVIDYRTGSPSGSSTSAGSSATKVNNSTVTSSKSVTPTHYRTEGYTSNDSNMQPYIVINYIIKAFQPPTDNVIKNLDPESLILDAFYPIGSCYETTNMQFNPNIVWGGTWTIEEISNDYIVDEGTSGMWTYRKWSSGIAELWGVKSIENVTINANATYNFNWDVFPFTFVDMPSVNVNYAATSWIDICAFYTYAGVGAIDSYAKNMVNTRFTGTVTGFASVKGKWKTYEAPTAIYKWTRTA